MVRLGIVEGDNYERGVNEVEGGSLDVVVEGLRLYILGDGVVYVVKKGVGGVSVEWEEVDGWDVFGIVSFYMKFKRDWVSLLVDDCDGLSYGEVDLLGYVEEEEDVWDECNDELEGVDDGEFVYIG